METAFQKLTPIGDDVQSKCVPIDTRIIIPSITMKEECSSRRWIDYNCITKGSQFIFTAENSLIRREDFDSSRKICVWKGSTWKCTLWKLKGITKKQNALGIHNFSCRQFPTSFTNILTNHCIARCMCAPPQSNCSRGLAESYYYFPFGCNPVLTGRRRPSFPNKQSRRIQLVRFMVLKDFAPG